MIRSLPIAYYYVIVYSCMINQKSSPFHFNLQCFLLFGPTHVPHTYIPSYSPSLIHSSPFRFLRHYHPPGPSQKMSNTPQHPSPILNLQHSQRRIRNT